MMFSVNSLIISWLSILATFRSSQKNEKDHKNHVWLVLEKLRFAGLYAKLEKCVFYQSQVEFLGYIISTEGLSMDPKKIEAVINWKRPSTIRDVKYFFGFVNFYRIFIQNYSKIAALLTKRFTIRSY